MTKVAIRVKSSNDGLLRPSEEVFQTPIPSEIDVGKGGKGYAMTKKESARILRIMSFEEPKLVQNRKASQSRLEKQLKMAKSEKIDIRQRLKAQKEARYIGRLALKLANFEKFREKRLKELKNVS